MDFLVNFELMKAGRLFKSFCSLRFDRIIFSNFVLTQDDALFNPGDENERFVCVGDGAGLDSVFEF